jgi:glycine/D-amino acid oxidase-like deaminating enzyme
MYLSNAFFDDDSEFEDEYAEREERYRRAYRDGWLGALDALAAFPHLSTEAAQERLFAHWDGQLYAWWEDDCRVKCPPPEMD